MDSTALRPHWRALDGLRGVAVMGVVLSHAQIRGAFNAGFLGVDVFFALSGFVVTYSILGTGGVRHWKRFLMRRFWRLYPALVAAVLLNFLLLYVIRDFRQPYYTQGLLAAITSTYNLLSYLGLDAIRGSLAFGPTWSLSIEWQFYALVVLVLVQGSHGFEKRLRRLCTGILVLTPVLTVADVLLYGTDLTYFRSEFRMGELASGTLFALWHRNRTQTKPQAWRVKLAAPAVVGLGLAVGTTIYAVDIYLPTHPNFRILFSYPVILMTLVAIHLATSDDRHGLLGFAWFLNSGVLRWLGRRSYAIYLFHWPLFVAFLPGSGGSAPLAALAVIGVTLIVAELSWWTIERPTQMNHRRRLARGAGVRYR